MNENFIENVKKALRLYVDREHNGVTSQAEKALGLSLIHISLQGQDCPHVEFRQVAGKHRP